MSDQTVDERLTRIETKLDIMGSNQVTTSIASGVLSQAFETRIANLEKWRAYLLGAAAALGGSAAYIFQHSAQI